MSRVKRYACGGSRLGQESVRRRSSGESRPSGRTEPWLYVDAGRTVTSGKRAPSWTKWEFRSEVTKIKMAT